MLCLLPVGVPTFTLSLTLCQVLALVELLPFPRRARPPLLQLWAGPVQSWAEDFLRI